MCSTPAQATPCTYSVTACTAQQPLRAGTRRRRRCHCFSRLASLTIYNYARLKNLLLSWISMKTDLVGYTRRHPVLSFFPIKSTRSTCYLHSSQHRYVQILFDFTFHYVCIENRKWFLGRQIHLVQWTYAHDDFCKHMDFPTKKWLILM